MIIYDLKTGKALERNSIDAREYVRTGRFSFDKPEEREEHFEEMKRPELMKLCSEKGIKFDFKDTKSDLIERLKGVE